MTGKKNYLKPIKILMLSLLLSMPVTAVTYADDATDMNLPTKPAGESDATDESGSGGPGESGEAGSEADAGNESGGGSRGDSTTDEEGGFSNYNISIGNQEAVDVNTGNIVTESGYAIDVGGTTTDAEGNLKFALDGFLSILFGAASVTLVFGLGKMFLSFKDDKPEEKVNASMYILASIIIFSLRGILDSVMGSDSEGTPTE